MTKRDYIIRAAILDAARGQREWLEELFRAEPELASEDWKMLADWIGDKLKRERGRPPEPASSPTRLLERAVADVRGLEAKARAAGEKPCRATAISVARFAAQIHGFNIDEDQLRRELRRSKNAKRRSAK